MAQVKIYPATQQQAQTIITKVENLDQKIQRVGLNAVDFGIVDFVNDPIIIQQGGLDQYNRRITT